MKKILILYTFGNAMPDYGNNKMFYYRYLVKQLLNSSIPYFFDFVYLNTLIFKLLFLVNI